MDVNGVSGRVPGSDAPLDDVDVAILDRIKRTVELLDPVPGGLAERSLFAMTLAGLEAELMGLQRIDAPLGSVRGDAPPLEARTITFTHESLTVMIALSPSDDGSHVRVDGWLAPAAELVVELRQPSGDRETMTDQDGRFVFDDVARGPASLLVRRPEDAVAVSTPVIEL
jgi:hypothetical protein